MFLGNKIRLYITELKKKNYIKFDQIKATYSKIKSSKVWSPLLLLGVAAFSSLRVGGAAFPSSFFGKVLRSPLSLLAGTAPSLPPWRLLSPPSVCFLPSSLGWCCSGASALDLSCRFPIVFSCLCSFSLSSFFWFFLFCFALCVPCVSFFLCPFHVRFIIE